MRIPSFYIFKLTFSVIVILSGCKKNNISVDELNGYWVLQSFEGKKASEAFKGALPTIEFDIENGMIYGTSGCNNYGGEFFIENDHLKINDLFSTEIACLEANEEPKFLNYLTQSYSLLLEGNTLKLVDNENNVIMEFFKGDPVKEDEKTDKSELERYTGEWV